MSDINSLLYFYRACGLSPAIVDTMRQLWSIHSSLKLSVLQCVYTWCHEKLLAAAEHCLVIGWQLSDGDGLWCWCIYLPSADRKLFLHLDWLGFISAASIALFNRVKVRRVCLLTQWDVHEDEKKTFTNLGWHWHVGSALLHNKGWI